MNSVVHKLAMGVVCVAAVLLFNASVQAGAWSNPSGTAPSGHFTWDSGHDLNGYFGDPTVTIDDKFVFDWASMGVSAYDGHTPDSLSDSIHFDIHLSPGYTLAGFEVRAYGDSLVRGAGSQVDLSATLGLEEFAAQPPNTNPRIFGDTLTTNPWTFPLICTGPTLQSTWSGIATVVVAGQLPSVDDDLHVSFTTIMNAIAAQNGLANLNLNFQQSRLEIALIPEPMSVLLLGLGALALLRRR